MIIDRSPPCRVAGGHQTLTAVCTNGSANYKSLKLLLPPAAPQREGRVCSSSAPERRRFHLTGVLTILTFALKKNLPEPNFRLYTAMSLDNIIVDVTNVNKER